MNNLIIGTLLYNEEKRFLKEYLEKISQLTNKLVYIDDGSTDNSLSIVQKYTSYIWQTNRMFVNNEYNLRKMWWEKATSLANDGDFIFYLDCDEIIPDSSINHFEEEIEKCVKLQGDGIGMCRYDMWNNTQYRDDEIWKCHKKPWVNCIRYYKNRENNLYKYWYNLKLHMGFCPINSYFNAFSSKIQVKHMAFSSIKLREEKVKFYNTYDPNPMPNMKKQYLSILDKSPHLVDFKDNYE